MEAVLNFAGEHPVLSIIFMLCATAVLSGLIDGLAAVLRRPE